MCMPLRVCVCVCHAYQGAPMPHMMAQHGAAPSVQCTLHPVKCVQPHSRRRGLCMYANTGAWAGSVTGNFAAVTTCCWTHDLKAEELMRMKSVHRGVLLRLHTSSRRTCPPGHTCVGFLLLRRSHRPYQCNAAMKRHACGTLRGLLLAALCAVRLSAVGAIERGHDCSSG